VAANKGQAFMGLAVLLGAAAAIAAYFSITMVARQSGGRIGQGQQSVVVTTADLTYGVKLEPEMLHVVQYPKDAVPAGAFSSVDSVAGQTTKVFLGAREPVTAIKLSSRGGGLSMLVRPTMRAASVEVNQVSGVSGFVLPGDRVDVLVTVDPRGGAGEEAVTRTILQNVEVLAAGQKTQQESNKPISVQAVTLLVDPQGAEQVALAMHEGEISLALRNPDDQDVVKTAAFSTRQMIGSAPAPAASKRVVKAAPKPEPARTVAKKDEPKVRIIRKAQLSETPAVKDTVPTP
jgi:pilus assembly protein CpaB